MLKIIKWLYENIKWCVKHQGFLSENFGSDINLFRVEMLLPEKKEEIWLSPVTKTPTPTEQ